MIHRRCTGRAALLVLLLGGCGVHESGDGSDAEEGRVDALWADRFLEESAHLISIPSWRGAGRDPAEVEAGFDALRDAILGWAREFEQGLASLRLEPFEWRRSIDGRDYRLFGLRLGPRQSPAGRGIGSARRIAIITHLDTVPPGSASWRPFEPRIERREYQGRAEVDFLVGRGAIDNKGPSVAALVVLRALAQRYDSSDALDRTVVELVFDTSEETDMATPHYLADPQVAAPDFGIVFDAIWCVRAEKGIERPVFHLTGPEPPGRGLWIDSLRSAPGPVNQIPAFAEAVIRSDELRSLRRFAGSVAERYARHRFDDPRYRRAALDPPVLSAGRLRLRTRVAGAQHGSAPHQNREDGANPLVSLTGFLAALLAEGELEPSGPGAAAAFATWAFGTRVFGENHPDLLVAHDDVFEEGNGTTYAVTKLEADAKGGRLEVDVRYALPHHGSAWDGRSPGLLRGESRFREVFATLTDRYRSVAPRYPVRFETRTLFAPDLRLPDAPEFVRVNRAFRHVTGRDCPMLGIGGGTDAKGHPELIAVGPLFSPRMGPPINYHGIDEGAPLDELRTSARILYHALVNEVESARRAR